ncbi:MAG: hypothetical protein RIF33_01075 [Cyclobacteriaceae bacterium]
MMRVFVKKMEHIDHKLFHQTTKNFQTIYNRINDNLLEAIDQHAPVEEIQSLLQRLNWINEENIREVGVPGEGNMNVVLRVTTDKRSVILK